MNQCVLNKKETVADYPELLKFWHPTKNGNLSPYDVAKGTDKFIWWICDKGHEYDGTPRRVLRGLNKKTKGCPFCAGQRVCLYNCLATTHPEIAKKWHPTKNGNLTPNDVTAGSSARIYWLCNKGVLCDHEWEAPVKKLKELKNGCPFCAGQRVCLDNCLATTHPELAKEWNKTKNKNLTPYDVTAGSEKKVYWNCKKHGFFLSRIDNRKIGQGCPRCRESKGEKKVQEALEKIGLLFKPQVKFPNCKNKNPLPFDFLVKINDKKGFLIEYQGKQHYEPIQRSKSWTKEMAMEQLIKTQENDKIKLEWTKKANVMLLVIPYWNLKNISSIIKNFTIDNFIFN